MSSAGVDPQLVLAFHQIGVETGRVARETSHAPSLIASLRDVWAAQVVAETFLLALDGSPAPSMGHRDSDNR